MSTEEVFNFDITVKGTAKAVGEGENRKLVLESVGEPSNIKVYNDKGSYGDKAITKVGDKMSVEKFKGEDYKPTTSAPISDTQRVNEVSTAEGVGIEMNGPERPIISPTDLNEVKTGLKQTGVDTTKGGRRTKAKRNKRKHRRTQYKK
jgi:hypothetical protein